MWTGSLRKWLVKLLAKAPATSGLLTLEDITNTKTFGRQLYIGETLKLTTELTNPQDPFAMAVIKDGCVVGHVPSSQWDSLLSPPEGWERGFLRSNWSDG